MRRVPAKGFRGAGKGVLGKRKRARDGAGIAADDTLVVGEASGPGSAGTLLKAATIESYVAAVADLYHMQVQTGTNKAPFFRGKALQHLIDSRRRQQDEIDRAEFADRGGQGPNSGYRESEFTSMMEIVLRNIVDMPDQVGDPHSRLTQVVSSERGLCLVYKNPI